MLFRKGLFSVVLAFFISISPAFSFGLSSKPNPYYYDNPKVVREKKRAIKKEAKEVQKDLKKVKKFRRKTLANIENNAPKTYEEYEKMAQDLKRSDFKLPEPSYEKDPKLVELPDPHIRIVKYNVPAGTKDLNLSEIIKNRKINSNAVLSPDLSKVVYSSSYYYPTEYQLSSELYCINVDKNATIIENLKNAHEIKKDRNPIMSTGLEVLQNKLLKTLVVIDWSKDGKKVAVKEKVGSSLQGIWQTNIWVYDFETQQTKKLNEVREAIKYYWKSNENLDLVDYMWDIYPVGWDANNPDRIILYAYAYTKTTPKFLGTWSIDSKGERSQLMSLKSTDFFITTNGYSLKSIVRE